MDHDTNHTAGHSPPAEPSHVDSSFSDVHSSTVPDQNHDMCVASDTDSKQKTRSINEDQGYKNDADNKAHRKTSSVLVSNSNKDSSSTDFTGSGSQTKSSHTQITEDQRTSSDMSVTEFSLESGEPADIVLEIGNKQLSCHKRVLCEHSLYFKAMFESGMQESHSNTVKLDNVHSDNFLCLVVYFYTGDLKLTQSNVQSVTELSNQFQVTNALDQCCKFLLTMIEDDLCLSLIRMSNLLMLTDVYNESRKHALWHFSTVTQSEDFFLAPCSQVLDFLQDPFLNVESEVDVFQAAADWYFAQDRPCDVTDFPSFLASTVNFHLMTDDEVASLNDLLVVKNNPELKSFVASLNQDVIASLKEKHPTGVRTSPRNGRILCVGAHQCTTSSGCQNSCPVAREETAPQEVLGFEPDGCSLELVASLSDHYPLLSRDAGYRVCAIGHRVYVVGGQASIGRSGGWMSTIWCLDTLRWSWEEVGGLQNVRRHHGMCAHGSTLFLVGGIGRFRVKLDSMESWDSETDEWSVLPQMLHQETAPAVTEHRGNIYVFKNYAQVFNIATSSWSFLKLSPPVPGLPIFAHSDPNSNGIFVTCFLSESLWFVDLDRKQSQNLVNFEMQGGGGVFCQGRLYHFQLVECDNNESTEVECYNTAEMARSVTGMLHRAFLTSNFVTVPRFPDFQPSSNKQLC
ncbi:kelch-like protein 18 [Littorina saxatilis]|uniref:BTB domain-containing protein n=1 Tax=Littorina saxatilis TaxID=31220 RepID=A0AAN9B9E1_9CAEN